MQEAPWWKPRAISARPKSLLRKWGIASAGKKAGRATRQGLIGTYIHARRPVGRDGGSQLRVRFRGPHRRFQGTGARRRDAYRGRRSAVSAQRRRHRRCARKREGYRTRRAPGTKASPRRCWTRSSKAGWQKFYEEVCLLEQPFVKEATLTIDQLVQDQDRQAGREHRRRPLRALQSRRRGRGRGRQRQPAAAAGKCAGVPSASC